MQGGVCPLRYVQKMPEEDTRVQVPQNTTIQFVMRSRQMVQALNSIPPSIGGP